MFHFPTSLHTCVYVAIALHVCVCESVCVCWRVCVRVCVCVRVLLLPIRSTIVALLINFYQLPDAAETSCSTSLPSTFLPRPNLRSSCC